jgi:succinate-acetate transporter protein
VSDEQLSHARVVLRPLANPMALGFIGLAVASLVDAGLALGWYPLSQYHSAAILILVFAPITQVIACVFGYLARDPIASTGMGVQAAAWAGLELMLLTGVPGKPQAVLGTFLFGAAAGIMVVSVVSMESKVVPAFVFAATSVRWALEGLYHTTGTSAWQNISGVVGLVICAAALYTALALALEDLRRRATLPTGRRDGGLAALEADLATQTSAIAAEAGVRAQL